MAVVDLSEVKPEDIQSAPAAQAPAPAQPQASGGDWWSANAPAPVNPSTNSRAKDAKPPVRKGEQTISAEQKPWYSRVTEPFVGEGSAYGTAKAKREGAKSAQGQDPFSKPLVDINAAHAEDVTSNPVARGAIEGVSSVASGFTTPRSIEIAAATGGLVKAPVIGRMIALGFGADQIKGALERSPELKKQLQAGDTEQASKTLTEMIAQGTLGVLGVRHGAKGEAKSASSPTTPPPAPPVEKPPTWEPAPPETPPTWQPGAPLPPVKRIATKRPPLAVTDAALSQLLKVEAQGPKREALIAEAKKRGLEVPELPTRGQEVNEALGETARVDQQFDAAEKKLVEKKQSQNPPKARKTAKPPFIPETGVPEGVARAQDARERIIGKPKEQWTNADIIAADKLIAEGYTGAGGSAEPSAKQEEPEKPTAAAPEKTPVQTPEEIDAERLKIIGKPQFQWTQSDIEAADQLRAEGQIGSTRPGPKEYKAPPPAPVVPKKEGPLLENVEAAPVEKEPIAETPAEPTPVAESEAPVEQAQSDVPPAFEGSFAGGVKGKAKTARGYKVPFRYAVVDADKLITSHDPTTLQENPAFDQSIQPRDRTRAGYEDQINTMVGTLDPEELGHSYKASDGAPIVGDDGMVESGNGRTIALKRVFESHPGKAEEYSNWINENADEFGIDTAALKDIKKPVLVRLRTGLPEGVTRQDFAQHANEDAKANMGAVEQANSDQKALTPDVMSLFDPSESGEINTAGNRAFVQKFASSVVGPGQKNPFMLADGSVSSEGVRRIRNAVFSKAYGGSTALEKLAEDPNDNTKSITSGLVIAAPKFANMQSAIEKGDLYDLNPAPAIGRAVARLTSLRDQKMSIEDFLKQEDIFGKDPVEGVILDIFDKNKRSAKRIASVFKHYVDAVEAIGSPKQQGFFAQDPPTIFEVLEAANDRVKEESKVVKDVPEEVAPPLLAEPSSSSGKD